MTSCREDLEDCLRAAFDPSTRTLRLSLRGVAFGPLPQRESDAALVGALILIGACGVIYLGMLHQGPVGLINAVSVFQPRLFLVPSVLLALVLKRARRSAAATA